MNEKLKQLAEQATEVSEWLSGNCSPDSPDLTKFAELIIRECADVADVADATREKWESIGKYVRQHFGVEE